MRILKENKYYNKLEIIKVKNKHWKWEMDKGGLADYKLL